MTTLTNILRRGALSLPISSLLLLTACGGSSSSAPEIDVTGYWLTYLQDPVSMDEQGPSGVYLSQSGAQVTGVFLSGTVSGSTLSVHVDLPGLTNTLQFTASMSGANLLGTYSMIGFPITGNFRMEPFLPAGAVTANGTVGGKAVSINSTSSWGLRSYDDQLKTSLQKLVASHDDGTVRFEVGFPQVGSVSVGALDASTVPVEIYFADSTGDTSVIATSGTVTVTQYDASGFVATFNLTLPGAESITGSFNVVWDINSYDP